MTNCNVKQLSNPDPASKAINLFAVVVSAFVSLAAGFVWFTVIRDGLHTCVAYGPHRHANSLPEDAPYSVGMGWFCSCGLGANGLNSWGLGNN